MKWFCNETLCKQPAAELKRAVKLPPVQPVGKIAGVAEVLELLRSQLLKQGRTLRLAMQPGDLQYALYTVAQVKAVRDAMIGQMYKHQPLSGTHSEPSDCENIAEFYSYTLHATLPGVPVTTVTGCNFAKRTAHAFIVVPCTDGLFVHGDLNDWDKELVDGVL